MDKRKFFDKKDLAVIIAVIIISILIFVLYQIFTNTENEFVQVMYNGEIIEEIDLNQDGEYTPKETPNIIIEIKDKKAHIKTSDCPDKICVNTGWLSHSGQTAVCLPNKLSIVIKSKSSNNTIDTEI